MISSSEQQQPPTQRNLICRQCGWVHFGVSRRFAEDAVIIFNRFFDGMDDEGRAQYGNRRCDITEYSLCDCCGAPNTESRDATPEELEPLYGCTMGALIYPEE